MPHNHLRVHCYAGSQKYYGDFMAPQKSRVWTTIQSDAAHKHIPAQIYLCNALKTPITYNKPVIYMVCCCKARMEKLFQSRGHSQASLPPSVPAVLEPQVHFPQITRLRGRVIVKTTWETSWLKVCAVSGKYIQCINTTSS